ncbi:MAG: hypothetical protein K1W38_05295 [Lachnospiraceae bacterium]|jgi:hypothetical protein
MGDGINELANVLNNQIKESGKRDVSVDFGTIEKNGFLITDILQTALGKDDYLVLHHIGELKEGDRVLVAWVYSDPVVVGKIRQEG